MKQVGCLCLLLVVLIVPVQVAAEEDDPERARFFSIVSVSTTKIYPL